MRFQLVLRRLILALALLGLVLAPVVRPAMAMTGMPGMTHQTMSDMSMGPSQDMNGMAADMECCPGMAGHADDAGKTAPANNDCGKDCPLMAGCVGASLTELPQAPSLNFPVAIREVVTLANDTDVASLTRAPSPRPPNA